MSNPKSKSIEHELEMKILVRITSKKKEREIILMPKLCQRDLNYTQLQWQCERTNKNVEWYKTYRNTLIPPRFILSLDRPCAMQYPPVVCSTILPCLLRRCQQNIPY